MILNENVPCRASRAWWLPFTSLALGLFTVPVTAQRAPREPERVEIRVNGKAVEELSSAERTALLKKLLAAETKAADTPAEEPAAPKPVRPGKKVRGKVDVAATPSEPQDDGGPHRVQLRVDAPSAATIGDLVRSGLAEARLEIAHDPDLVELGIDDELGKLLDDLGAGKGLGANLDAVVRGAMQGAGKLVEKELANDADLRELGLADSINQFVQRLLGDGRMQELMCDAAHSAFDRALQDVHRDLRRDPGLRELGIELDTSALVDSLLHGGNFDVHLQGVIDKALESAALKVRIGEGEEPAGAEPLPPPAPKKKAKKAKADVERTR